MSFFIAGRKDTLAILETGGRSPDIAGDIVAAMRSSLCINYGIADSNLSMLVVTDDSATAIGISDGAEYTAVWTAGEITGVDFTPETTKRIVKVSATKTTILADNTDSTVITIELWKADNSGIATSVTAAVDVPIGTPTGPRKVRMSLVNGVATRTFKTLTAGTWTIPSPRKRYASVRIDNNLVIESIQTFDTL
jgi:hypothetical protein